MSEIRNNRILLSIKESEKNKIRELAGKCHLSMTECIVQAIDVFAEYIKNGGEVKR